MNNAPYLHPFHLVHESPWPLMSAWAGTALTTTCIIWFQSKTPNLLLLSMVALGIICYQWWRDISIESTHLGAHSKTVQNGLRWGMILFIVSEVLFFMAFFWAFFHSSLSPLPILGNTWPPTGVSPFNPMSVPLLNTIILLSSGMTVTWSHHALLAKAHNQALLSLMLTIMLGAYFSALQAYEYMEAPFTMADSAYGATFFLATGFHGAHVLIGTSFLMICSMRIMFGHMSNQHHFGFEAAAWYWHFVDVVWLFLFINIYWWGAA